RVAAAGRGKIARAPLAADRGPRTEFAVDASDAVATALATLAASRLAAGRLSGAGGADQARCAEGRSDGAVRVERDGRQLRLPAHAGAALHRGGALRVGGARLRAVATGVLWICGAASARALGVVRT